MTFRTPCYRLSSICINYLVLAHIVGNIVTQHHTSVAKEGVWWSFSFSNYSHSRSNLCSTKYGHSRSNLCSTKYGQLRPAPRVKPHKMLLIGAG